MAGWIAVKVMLCRGGPCLMAARILLVEDNATNLELMTYLLDCFGYAVLPASTGSEAISLVGKNEIDLALLDIQLPDMDGFQLFDVLRRLPRLRDVSFVAVTAMAMVGDRDRVLAAGFDGYIPKPIEPMRFVPEIERFLPEAQRSGRLPPSWR